MGKPEDKNPHKGDWAIQALRDAIKADGRGVTKYSTQVLIRPAPTVHRWLRGATPIPAVVRKFLTGEFRILAPPLAESTTDKDEK